MSRTPQYFPRRTHRWLIPLVIVVVAGLAATAALVFVTNDEPKSSAAQPTAATPTTTPTPTHTRVTPTPDPTPTTDGTIAVIGDSFVVGVGGGSDYVALMAPLLGVKTAAFGQSGTGFVNYGSGLPYDQRVAAVMATKPVGLVFQASVNDYLTSTDAVVAAASQAITHARSIDPDLAIAIVGPIYLGDEAQPAVLSQRAGLKELSEVRDVTYVDPTGWITDATKAQNIGPDNLHPTRAGYQRIAEQMAAELRPFATLLQ